MSDDDLEARRARLKNTVDAHEAAKAEAEAPESGSMSGYGAALRMSSDFVAGVAVGGLLGFGFDWVFGTSPWLLIVFLLLGFAAGVRNVLRTADLIQQPQAGKRPPVDEGEARTK